MLIKSFKIRIKFKNSLFINYFRIFLNISINIKLSIYIKKLSN